MSQATQTAGHRRASARLGLTLRSMLLSPRTGFEAAITAWDRRSRTVESPSEGASPTLLAFSGGAGAMLLWLKVGALLGARDGAEGFEWSLLLAALAIGGLVYVLAQALWGLAGPRVISTLRGSAPSGLLRLVWAAAACPMALGLLLLPVDLVVVGPEAVTSSGPGETMATAWAALSISLHVAAAVWSLYLLFRGTQVVGRIDAGRAMAAIVAGLALVALLIAGLQAGLSALSSGPA